MISSLPVDVVEALTATLEPLGPWPPHGAIEGTPTAYGVVIAQTDSSEAGIWECTPGRYTSKRDGACEMMHFIAGAGAIVDADGTRHEIRPGTMRFLPDGWSGEFDITETVRKVYVSMRTS